MARRASCAAWLSGACVAGLSGIMLISVLDTACSLPTGDTSENGSDRHAEAGQIALAENAARHDFTGSEKVFDNVAILHDDLGALVHLHAEIGESDARTQR